MDLYILRLKIGSSDKQVLDGFYLGLRCNIVEVVPENDTLFEIFKGFQLYFANHHIVTIEFPAQSSPLVISWTSRLHIFNVFLIFGLCLF